MSETMTPIALLSQSGDSGRHLRDALAASGTPIVYEAEAAALDRDALERSGARVVVVNLDTEVEAHLDDVYALLGDDRYNVIFNEAQVSSQLSGWEQARWARHLAAKIMGVGNADPPRPEGAESVPERVLKIADPVPEAEADAPVAGLLAEPVVQVASATPVAQVGFVDAVATDDFADIVSLLDEVSDFPEMPASAATAGGQVSGNAMFETMPMPVLDFSEFDEPLTEQPVADSFEPVDSALIESDGEDDEPDLESLSVETLQMPAFDAAEDVLGFGDLDDFAGEGDGSLEIIEPGAGPDQTPVRIEVELADSAEISDSAAAESELSDLELLDLDWADTPAAVDAELEIEQESIAPPPAVGSAFSWSLEDLDEDSNDARATAADRPIEAKEFGIEKISASDYLAPDVDEAMDEPLDSGFSLELIPLDEAVAPQGVGSTAGKDGNESWLDPSATRAAITQVWVLGASIGGPEAVREFLAELPKNCPALFLLAQHMGAEFMEIMAQQLSRSTVLTVRTPTHGERVSHGDIVVVPTTHRLRVDREGVITLEPLADSNQSNTPSIDQVLRDVADRFGAKAGVIVFSGMAEDAAEGSRYLAEIGGKVYVQDPETCVISSMVDGVIETGVVSFAGSPKALAGKVLGDLKMAAKT